MHQSQVFQKIFTRFFPKKYLQGNSTSPEYAKLDLFSEEKKKKYAKKYVNDGEMLLLKGDLAALRHFEKALFLDSTNPEIWLQQALAFFEYGTHRGSEKALLFSSKSLKMATSFRPNYFDAYVAWGNVLVTLGNLHDEHHYFLDAKEKYQRAISLAEGKSKDELAELYWDYALVWMKNAEHSGEAVDVRMALQAYRTSFHAQEALTPEFWCDYGNAYLQMSLLINDSRLLGQAVEYFEKAIDLCSEFELAWSLSAEANTQLYINTMDEKYFTRANHCFSQASSLNQYDADLWLRWSQILGESGKLNKDPKKLQLSVEKAVRAYSYASQDTEVLGQWVESLACLGACSNRLDLISEAEDKIIKALEIQDEQADLWHAYGMCMVYFAEYFEDIEYYEAAIEKFQQGLSLDRTNAELWQYLAYAHSEIGQKTEDTDILKRALRFYARAIDLKPSCPSLAFQYALTLFKLSEITHNTDNAAEAVYQFECSLEAQKDALLHHPQWLFHYACALDLYGDLIEDGNYYARAIEILLHVLLIDPDFPNIHYRLALCFSHHAELTGDVALYKKSLDYFQHASKQDDEDGLVYLEWGLTLINLSHHILEHESSLCYYEEAEQKILKAGQCGNQHAYYHLGCLYSLMERFPEAIYFLEKAQQLLVLPSIDELMQDEWLEGLRETHHFSAFLSLLESRQNATEDYYEK